MSSSLPDGFNVRPATVDDAPAINELVTAADVAVQGWSESSEGELLGWWRLMDLEHNSWVLREGEEVAAYAVGFAHADMLELDGFVHPERRGRGLGAWLVARAEERARELGKQRLLAFSLAGDDLAHRLFEQFGMRDLRRYYRMMIDLESEPAPPRWPDGLHVDTFEPEDAKAFHDALGEAFEEEWNFVRMPFDEWRELRLVTDPDCVTATRSRRSCATSPIGPEPASSVRSACASRGASAGSPSRCCSTRSASSTAAASAASLSGSMRRTRPVPRGCTSEPACTSPTRS